MIKVRITSKIICSSKNENFKLIKKFYYKTKLVFTKHLSPKSIIKCLKKII